MNPLLSATAMKWNEIAYTEETVVALGNFDGVHRGHQQMIKALIEKGKELGLRPVVITFSPHPRQFFCKEHEFSVLSSTRENKMRIEAIGPVQVQSVHFNQEFASLSPTDFALNFLIERLKAKYIFMGPNHKFGKAAQGSFDFLKDLMFTRAVGVEKLKPLMFEGQIISSSRIKESLQQAKIKQANQMLGYLFNYQGVVVRGDGRGRILGFPTANLRLNEPKAIKVGTGVYGAYVQIEGKKWPAVVNIGKTPTFKSQVRKIEAFILDFSKDIYDKTIGIELNCYLRNEKEFDSVEQLVTQIAVDVEQYKKIEQG